ncbi:MAG: hypothetical protein HC914_20485 [Chloroflexaceae bacterium]|nr:hypothetical protein [Chloroflexaceae bacterium]
MNQIAYSVGRVRLRHANVYRWLLLLLHHNSCFITKATALQSLAWIGIAEASLSWLDDVIRSIDLPYPPGLGTHEIVRTAIEDIATWNRVILTKLNSFAGSMQDWSGATPAALNLRRTAIQALGLIGDGHTLERIQHDITAWPLTLRTEWHLSSLNINQRLYQQAAIPAEQRAAQEQRTR